VIGDGNLFTEVRPVTKDRYSPYQRIPNKKCETETKPRSPNKSLLLG